MKSLSKIIVLFVLIGLQGCDDQEVKSQSNNKPNVKKQETTPITRERRDINEHIPYKGDLLQVIYVSSF